MFGLFDAFKRLAGSLDRLGSALDLITDELHARLGRGAPHADGPEPAEAGENGKRRALAKAK